MFFSCVGFDQLAKVLIQKGADVGAVNSLGDTALFTAAANGKILKILIIIRN